jgi:hypothetical protein
MLRVHQAQATCAAGWARREGLLPAPGADVPGWVAIVVRAAGSPEGYEAALRRGFAEPDFGRAIVAADAIGGDAAVRPLVEAPEVRRKRLAREASEARERKARATLRALEREAAKLEKKLAEAREVVRRYDRKAKTKGTDDER